MKARNLIPGWPRGRSTSRSAQRLKLNGFMVYTERYFSPAGFDYAGFAPECNETAEEWDEFLAEERRKADMMEAWYEKQRIATGGWWRHAGNIFQIESDYLFSAMVETEGARVVSSEELLAAVRHTIERLQAKCGTCGAMREDHIERDPEYPACDLFTERSR